MEKWLEFVLERVPAEWRADLSVLDHYGSRDELALLTVGLLCIEGAAAGAPVPVATFTRALALISRLPLQARAGGALCGDEEMLDWFQEEAASYVDYSLGDVDVNLAAVRAADAAYVAMVSNFERARQAAAELAASVDAGADRSEAGNGTEALIWDR